MILLESPLQKFFEEVMTLLDKDHLWLLLLPVGFLIIRLLVKAQENPEWRKDFTEFIKDNLLIICIFLTLGLAAIFLLRSCSREESDDQHIDIPDPPPPLPDSLRLSCDFLSGRWIVQDIMNAPSGAFINFKCKDDSILITSDFYPEMHVVATEDGKISGTDDFGKEYTLHLRKKGQKMEASLSSMDHNSMGGSSGTYSLFNLIRD